MGLKEEENHMKKKLLALLLCLALSLSLSACGSSQTTGVMSQVTNTSGSNDDLPVVKWKMASTWGSGNVHFTVDQRFSELVSQLTNGKFQITNYGEGEVCAANAVFDTVQDGTVQCAGDWAGYWAGKDPAFELLSTTMNLFSGLDYYVWFEQGGGIEVARSCTASMI